MKHSEVNGDWQKIRTSRFKHQKLTQIEKKSTSHTANVLGRTFAEVLSIL
jgi:hypothetical protein